MNELLICLVIVVIIAILYYYYSPRRMSELYHIGRQSKSTMCPPRTGMNYLDVYEQQDYYKNNPQIYPTPQTYTTLWYKARNIYDHLYSFYT